MAKAYFLILIWSAVTAACFRGNIKQGASENAGLPDARQNSTPFFEIYHETVGPWKVTGKTLFFRLYKNGIAEFDVADDAKLKDGARNKTEEIYSIKQVRIGETDFQKFQALFETADFQNDFQIVKKSYQGKRCTEGSSSYKVVLEPGGRQKTVEINPVCELNELTNRDTLNSADIPATLSELIRLAHVTKLKFVSRQ